MRADQQSVNAFFHGKSFTGPQGSCFITLRNFISMLGGSLLATAAVPVFTVSAAETTATQVSKPLTLLDLADLRGSRFRCADSENRHGCRRQQRAADQQADQQLDGAAALVLTFNQPLDDKQDLTQKVRLTDDKLGRLGMAKAQRFAVVRQLPATVNLTQFIVGQPDFLRQIRLPRRSANR
jgi:hypothetical protein